MIESLLIALIFVSALLFLGRRLYKQLQGSCEKGNCNCKSASSLRTPSHLRK